MPWLILSILSVCIWLYLTFGRGNFWYADQRLSGTERLETWPEIVAIIPARDEAPHIEQVITAHLATDYPGIFNVIVVDDQSTDSTGECAARGAQNRSQNFHLVPAAPLEAGWSGKLWAVQNGLEKADTIAPSAKYLLLTDADILHDPKTLRRLVTKAEKDGLALTSLMARLDDRGFWGGLLVPAFIYFFQKLYPFAQSNDPWSPVAAAAGGCMLVNKKEFQDAGGMEPIKHQLIDDCALAKQLKGKTERRIWLGLAVDEVISLRDNRSLQSIWKMVARTAFTQLDYSWFNSIGTVASMALIYLMPMIVVASWPLHQEKYPLLFAVIAWLFMVITYRPTLKLYDQPILRALALPIAAFLYTLMTISSAWKHARGRGGQWKGRHY